MKVRDIITHDLNRQSQKINVKNQEILQKSSSAYFCIDVTVEYAEKINADGSEEDVPAGISSMKMAYFMDLHSTEVEQGRV